MKSTFDPLPELATALNSKREASFCFWKPPDHACLTVTPEKFEGTVIRENLKSTRKAEDSSALQNSPEPPELKRFDKRSASLLPNTRIDVENKVQERL